MKVKKTSGNGRLILSSSLLAFGLGSLITGLAASKMPLLKNLPASQLKVYRITSGIIGGSLSLIGGVLLFVGIKKEEAHPTRDSQSPIRAKKRSAATQPGRKKAPKKGHSAAAKARKRSSPQRTASQTSSAADDLRPTNASSLDDHIDSSSSSSSDSELSSTHSGSSKELSPRLSGNPLDPAPKKARENQTSSSAATPPAQVQSLSDLLVQLGETIDTPTPYLKEEDAEASPSAGTSQAETERGTRRSSPPENLFDAIRACNVNWIRSQAKAGQVDVTAPIACLGDDERLPLSLAITFGNKEVVEALLDLGADPNATTSGNFEKVTPLGDAIFNEEVVRLLIERGIDFSQEQNIAATTFFNEGLLKLCLEKGLSPKRYASVKSLNVDDVRRRFRDSYVIGKLEKACQSLAKERAAVNQRSAETVSHGGGQQALFDAIEKKDPEAIHSLARQNLVDLNAPNTGGAPPLFQAITKGDDKVVCALLEAGASPNVCSHLGTSALRLACALLEVQSRPPNKKIVEQLLQKGANPNGRHSQKVSERLQSYEPLFRLLLEKGLDREQYVRNQALTKAKVAAKFLDPTINRMLGEACEALEREGQADTHETVPFRAPQTAPPVKSKEEDSDRLYNAILKDDARAIGKLAKKRSISVNEPFPCKKQFEGKRSFHDGKLPLVVACEEGKEAAAVALIEAGAQTSITCSDARPLLYHAISKNLKALVQALLERGIDPNAETEGVLPLQQAVTCDAIFLLLLKNGADPSRESGGLLLLQRVAAKEKLFKALVQKGADLESYVRKAKVAKAYFRAQFKSRRLIKRLEEAFERVQSKAPKRAETA